MTPQAGSWTQVDVAGAIATHAADLDAHTRNPLQVFRVGNYMPPAPTDDVSSLRSVDAGYLTAIPCIITRPMTFDRIAMEVSIVGVAGAKARLGIYTNDTNLYPGALLLDAGEIDATVLGVSELVIDQQLTRGIYWLAVLVNETIEFIGHLPSIAILGLRETEFDKPYAYWRKTDVTYGALPNPFPAGGSEQINYGPTPCLRLASLD